MVHAFLVRKTLQKVATACLLMAAGFAFGRFVQPSGIAIVCRGPESTDIAQSAESMSSLEKATVIGNAFTLNTTATKMTKNMSLEKPVSTSQHDSRNSNSALLLFLPPSLTILHSQLTTLRVKPTAAITTTKAAPQTISTNTAARTMAHAFRPRMNADEKAAALRNMAVLDEALRNASVTYFLYGGTLLGARRHRGIIPWDDDLDVLANYTQLNELKRALRLVAGYDLNVWHKYRYKFYATDGALIRGVTFRWPYVDVCFFSENATHLYENFPGLSGKVVHAKADVFPLVYRPFDGLELPTPANEERVVAQQNFDERTCKTQWFSHREESRASRSDAMTVPCTALHSMYPFIFRNGTTPPIGEVLKVGDSVVREFVSF